MSNRFETENLGYSFATETSANHAVVADKVQKIWERVYDTKLEIKDNGPYSQDPTRILATVRSSRPLPQQAFEAFFRTKLAAIIVAEEFGVGADGLKPEDIEFILEAQKQGKNPAFVIALAVGGKKSWPQVKQELGKTV